MSWIFNEVHDERYTLLSSLVLVLQDVQRMQLLGFRITGIQTFVLVLILP